MKLKLTFLAMVLFTSVLQAQRLTQTVRGIVLDKDAQIPLVGATIVKSGAETDFGTTTNANGEFTLPNVPVGRHNFKVSYMGYEPCVLNELLVGSAKEVVLNIELVETINNMEEVVVMAKTRKDQPLNFMSTVSSRVFSVEEASRYAGGFDDPTRLASSFAGVAASEIESNGISVRGNSPAMVQYQMEGVEIDNANHFEGGDMLGGGFVSLFNSHLLANSDFMTGAFPAQYGNALSATFDMKLRNGNNQKHEHAAQIGVMGIDIASEGPIKKGGKASYLFNYRYSTFGLLTSFLPEGEGLPVYQDLTYKINLPSKAGTFALWGTGAIDNFYLKAKDKPEEWNMEAKRMEIKSDFAPMMTGLTHKYVFDNQSYINTCVLYSYNQRQENVKWMNDELNLNDLGRIKNTTQSTTVSSYYNKKLSKMHTNRTGVSYKFINFNFDEWASEDRVGTLENISQSSGSSALLQAYSQSKYTLSDKTVLNVGLHYQRFDLNKESSFEPRLGLKHQFSQKFSVSAAYGRHSRMQMLNHYFIKDKEGSTPNKDLGFTKANHYVLGFDYKINPHTRLKVEPYFQQLSAIPVIPDSSFAIINLQDTHTFNEILKNKGTGTNIGIEFTLERFLNKGFYYLITASVYDSKYKGGDGVERNTMYNGNYILNILGGKEWAMGREKNNIFGLNGRLYLQGGNRQSPVDYEASFERKEVKYDHTRLFEERKSGTARLDLTLSYTRNRPKFSSTWSLQLLNALGTVITYNQEYDFVKDEVVEMEGRSVLPNISYKIMF